jgi:uncharacterized cupin superfamily protein
MAGDVSFATLDRGGAERFHSLRTELGVESFGINLITLAPGQRGRVHLHERQEEVYLVLEGELTLGIEGVEHRLGPDQIARVPASVRRQIANEGTQQLVLLALGGAGEHAGRDAVAWTSWEESGPGHPPQEVPLPDDPAAD